MSQISQDSADADAPASSIDSTSVLENEPVAKVNEPVAKVNVPPTYFSNRHSHKYHHNSILKFQKILVKGLKIYNSSNGTFFTGFTSAVIKSPITNTSMFQYIQAVSPIDHSYKELRSTKVSNVTATPKKRRLKAQFIFKRKQGGA